MQSMSIAAVIAVTDGASEVAINELMTKVFCLGDACAMWEPEYKLQEKVVLVDDEVPKGWHEKNQEKINNKHVIFRYIPTDSGDCGLKTKENGCSYPG